MSPKGNLPDIIWKDTSDSTNSEVLRSIRQFDNMSMLAAVRQTGGRGQGSHVWEAEAGENITASLILKDFGIQASEAPLISAAAAMGVYDYLKDRGIGPRIKLPNDIWVGDRKICGLLIENLLCGKSVSVSVIGIGLNVNQTTWGPGLPNPVSMKELTGKDYDTKAELESLRTFIARRLEYTRTPEKQKTLISDFDMNSFSNDSLTVPFGTPSGWHQIGILNWPEKFPYKPDVRFRVWHDGQFFHIEYNVTEETTKAEQKVPGGPVYEDSCVECFIKPEGGSHYYNFEWNAAGKLAMARRTGRNDPEDAPTEILGSVTAISSLGNEAFGETSLGKPWSLKVDIPCTALFGDSLQSWSGQKMKMNFYKCGDALKTMHFVTWAPISTPKPDYHRPEFFREVVFE